MLHFKTVAPDTLGLLKKLQSKPYLKDFVLVGGTSLALQIGHRLSIDLDLFTTFEYDTAIFKNRLLDDFPDFQLRLEGKNTIISSIESIKVDFVRFKYDYNFPILEIDNIRLADIRDIAPMKIDAICGRGKKKDFFDLYFLLQHFSMSELLEIYQNKFQHTTLLHVLRSILYFNDAEIDDDPVVFDKKATWPLVKKTIEIAVKNL
jgi:hypothetical protein